MAFSLLAELSAQRYPFKHYSTGDGLLLGAVTAIHQDSQGYIWFGTLNGASRFDGESFTSLTIANGLSDNAVRAIYEDRSGSLWFGTERGLNRKQGDKITHYTTKEGLINDRINMMLQDKSGALWIATPGGLSKFEGEKFINYTSSAGLPPADISVVLQDQSGHLLAIGRTGGISQLTGATFKHWEPALRWPNAAVLDAREDAEGNLWVATQEGLLKISEGKATTYTNSSGLGSNRVNCILIDVKGVAWAGTDGGGLSKMAGRRFITFTARNGLANNRIHAIMQDAEGNLWVGTDAGATRLPGDWFANYTSEFGLIDNNVWAIHEDKSGNVWIGTAAGLSQLSQGRFVSYTTADGLADNRVRAILEDREGDLWVGTDGGLVRLRGSLAVPYTTEAGLVGNQVRVLLEDRDGSIWIGTHDRGISQFSNGRFVNYSTDNGLPNNRIHGLAQDAHGAIWIATDGAGLVEFSGGKFTAYTSANGLLSNNLTCLTIDRAGNIWVGTNGRGVSQFSGGQFTNFTTEKGLSDDRIYFALEGAKGELWFGTGRGVDRYAGQRFKTYTVADGLAGNTVNPNAAMRDQFGTFWFGTIFGLSQYNPEQSLDLTTPPPVYLTRVLAANKDKSLAANQSFSHSENYLSFRFHGLSYRAPDRLRYQYMLDGLDKDWSEATSARSVQYTALQPGQYIFRVRALTMDGVASATPATFAFTLQPPFWRTWWFLVLVLMSIGFALFQMQRRYVQKFEAQHTEVEQMITREREGLQKELLKAKSALMTLEAASRATTFPVDVTNLDRLVPELLTRSASELGPGVNTAILLLDSERGELVARARIGSRMGEDSIDRVPLSGTGLTAYAARTGTVVNVKDVNADPRYLRGWQSAQSELVVPLKVGSHILGVIDAQSPTPAAFSDAAANYLSQFADRAALAIWTAKFAEEANQAYEKLQDAQNKLVTAERLAALSQLGVAIQNEIGEPMGTLLDYAERALKNSRSAPIEIRQQLQVIYDMAVRVQEIILDLRKVQEDAADYIEATIMSRAKTPASEGPDLDIEDISIARLRSNTPKR